MIQMKPDHEAFERVCKELDSGIELNCKHIVDIFGWPSVELFLLLVPENKKITELLKEIKRKL